MGKENEMKLILEEVRVRKELDGTYLVFIFGNDEMKNIGSEIPYGASKKQTASWIKGVAKHIK